MEHRVTPAAVIGQLVTAPTGRAIVTVVVIGYLLGSIPVADLVARRRGADDLRTVGDRNPGYWNAKETLGRRSAIPVFVGDTVKGALAAGVGAVAAADGQWWLAYIGAAAAMVGHSFPITARFRGGRSVLTFVGGALVFAPVTAAISVTLLFVVWGIRRDFAMAARVGMVSFPIVQLTVDGPYRTAATGALMTFIGLRFAQAAWTASRTPSPATSDDA